MKITFLAVGGGGVNIFGLLLILYLDTMQFHTIQWVKLQYNDYSPILTGCAVLAAARDGVVEVEDGGRMVARIRGGNRGRFPLAVTVVPPRSAGVAALCASRT